jgi:putative ABC transport system permease protein
VGAERPARVQGAAVSPALFSALRVVPAAGSFFNESQTIPSASDVVVLSYELWDERFGARPAAIGQTLVLDGRPHTIVGIAPRGFAFPDADMRLWTPYVLPTVPPGDAGRRPMRVVLAVARLGPGATPAQAAAEGTAAARSGPRPIAADLLYGKGGEVEVRVAPLADEMTSDVRPALLVLATGVGLVLLVACANVANLTLARGVARRRELAVRIALGARHGRLVQQLLSDSLVLAIAGGGLGVLLAWWLVRVLPVAAPESFPRVGDVRLDGVALLFAVLVAGASGSLAGLVPAWRTARLGLASLTDGDRRSTLASGRGLRSGLLVAEAALAVVLLVGAALLVRSFARLTQVDAGFDPANVVTGQVFLPNGADAALRSAALLDRVLPRLEQIPGVVAVGAANMAPFGNSTSIVGFEIGAARPDGTRVIARANSWVVTPGFGRALGLRITEGRFPTAGDVGPRVDAMAVNEEFVRLFLSDGQPVIGRRFNNLTTDRSVETVIIGVVANVLMDGPNRAPQPEIFRVPGHGVAVTRQFFLALRTAGDPVAVVPDVRRLVTEEDPAAALDGVGPLATKVSAAVAQPRFAASILAASATLTLLLAAVGLYGALSCSVSERRRELGIRSAVGASRTAIVRLVVNEGLRVVVPGLVIGLVASTALTGLLRQVLFGIAPLDSWSFVLAPAILMPVALAACLVPARRAADTDPADVLRTE